MTTVSRNAGKEIEVSSVKMSQKEKDTKCSSSGGVERKAMKLNPTNHTTGNTKLYVAR